MYECLENVIQQLEASKPSSKRLGSAVSLICSIGKLLNKNHIPEMKENAMIALLRMIAL